MTGENKGRYLWWGGVALCLSVFFLVAYARIYQPRYGWTKLILFGSEYAQYTLPQLQRAPHYVDPTRGGRMGYDGQYYAQIALDPSLRSPALNRALDNPAYRARRIGMPALAYLLGGGEPERVLQAFALVNLGFWFVLLGVLSLLFRPWTFTRLLCLSTALVSFGVISSMDRALTDLPAAALIFAGVLIGSWGGYAAFAAAILMRETSVLAAFACLDFQRPWRRKVWKRNLGWLTLAALPTAGWFLYVHHRFGAVQPAAGERNFGWPLQAMGARAVLALQACGHLQHGVWRHFYWLYGDFKVHEVLTLLGLCVQGLYLLTRPDPSSAFWRIGVCFLLLGAVLGPAVWAETAAAARVLLPLTICFYLLVARERGGMFWWFFILGSLSVPYGLHKLWMLG